MWWIIRFEWKIGKINARIHWEVVLRNRYSLWRYGKYISSVWSSRTQESDQTFSRRHSSISSKILLQTFMNFLKMASSQIMKKTSTICRSFSIMVLSHIFTVCCWIWTFGFCTKSLVLTFLFTLYVSVVWCGSSFSKLKWIFRSTKSQVRFSSLATLSNENRAVNWLEGCDFKIYREPNKEKFKFKCLCSQ